MAGFSQQSFQGVFFQKHDEAVPLKRQKKEPGAPTQKNVVVLKSSDVTTKDDVVFMPNTIEMAQLKKATNGRFKNMQISSNMTEAEIEDSLKGLFPCLKDKRFYCASAADNRTRLDFHGERRIWNGHLIKQKIKGNSVLYIFIDKESNGKHYSTVSKQTAVKRPYDQIATPEKERAKETDRTLPREDVVLDQPWSVGSTVSAGKQSAGQPTLNISHGTTGPAGSSLSSAPRSDPERNLVSSTLTTQLSSLNISSTAILRHKGQGVQTKVIAKQGHGSDTNTGVQDAVLSSLDQSQQRFVVNTEFNCTGEIATDRRQENAGSSGSDYESQFSDSAAGRLTDSGIEASDSLCLSEESSEAGFEPVLAGISVPENLENILCPEILERGDKKDLSSDGGPSTASTVNDTSTLDSALEEIIFSEELDYIPDLETGVFGGVEDIFPSCGSVQGGFEFRISLKEALPDNVKSGHAWFDKVAIVPVHKLNPFTLYGTVPRSQVTGDVVVGVLTDSFQELGNTLFKYIDDGENTLKQFIQDPALQARYFTMLAGNLANGIPTSGGHFTQALGPMNVLQNGSSIQAKQEQSVELLQLMVYTAAQTGAQRFIEMVFSTSAGQVVFNSYKDRNPLPEDVARANGHEELAQYLHEVHTRLSLDKNVHSTVIDWLELVEAVQKQSLTTQDESPIGLDQSDEDDDDSSDYFADAETSSCGSFDDDPGWPEISEKKEPYVHDEISSEVQASSENNDLSTTSSTKASFTKNEGITKGESTKGKTARDDICFVVKQGSSCLDKGRETEEYSELSSSLSCVADLLEMSCDDLNKENSISKGPCIHGEISSEVQSIGECNDLSRTCSSEASFTKNERIRTGESTKRQITRDEISFVVKQGSSCLDKGEEREIAELSKPQRITSLPELFAMSCEDPGEGNLITKTSRNNMAKQPKEPCIQEVTSNEVRPVEIIVSWCDDLSMTSSKASFTKNEKIVEVESTKRQTTSEDRAFATKQGSSCLEKGKEREFSELPRPHQKSCLPKLLGMSCEDLNSGDIVRTESSTGDGIYVQTNIKSTAVSDHSQMNKFAMKTSDRNNDRILTDEELNQEPTAKPDGISMNSKGQINKEDKDPSAAEEGVIWDPEGSRICWLTNFRALMCRRETRRLSEERILQLEERMLKLEERMLKSEELILEFKARRLKLVVLSGDSSEEHALLEELGELTFAEKGRMLKELKFAEKKLIFGSVKWNHWFCFVDSESRGDIKKGETCLNVLKLLIKEYQLLEREQLFALQRFLAHKLSTKTKQFVNVHLVKRTRKFLTTCEACNDPVSKSASSDEREPNEIEFVKVFEVSDNFGADH